MTNDPLAWLDDAIRDLSARCLLRQRAARQGPQHPAQTGWEGRTLVNFGSNDYLGLAADGLSDAVRAALDSSGWGSGASPLVTGRGEIHARLEGELAEFEGTEAALLFPSGFAANLATIAAVVGRGDVVYSDARNHASIIDGCRLSGASIVVYPHGDTAVLHDRLREGSGFRRRLIVTDTLFSMDGDLAPLADLADLAERYRAMLMVDEAHATGVFGRLGRGVCEHLGVESGVHIRVGTLSKALGSIGGFVAGQQRLIDWLANRARAYVFSTATPEAAAAAASQALRIVRQQPERRCRLLETAADLRCRLQQQGWSTGRSVSQIVPVILGDPARTMDHAARLRHQDLFVPGIRPPTVPPGQSLLRISLCHGHTQQHIQRLLDACCVLQEGPVRVLCVPPPDFEGSPHALPDSMHSNVPAALLRLGYWPGVRTQAALCGDDVAGGSSCQSGGFSRRTAGGRGGYAVQSGRRLERYESVLGADRGGRRTPVDNAQGQRQQPDVESGRKSYRVRVQAGRRRGTPDLRDPVGWRRSPARDRAADRCFRAAMVPRLAATGFHQPRLAGHRRLAGDGGSAEGPQGRAGLGQGLGLGAGPVLGSLARGAASASVPRFSRGRSGPADHAGFGNPPADQRARGRPLRHLARRPGDRRGGRFRSDGHRTQPGHLPVACRGWRGAERDTGQSGPGFSPAYSPDGQWLAFSRRQIRGFYADRARLALYHRPSGEYQILTEDFDRTVNGAIWAPDSSGLYAAVDDAAHYRIYRIDVPSGQTVAITREHSFTGLRLSADGSVLVALRQSFSEPPTLVRVDPASGDVTKLSTFNDSLLADVTLGRYESVTYPGANDVPIQMWVVYPPGFDPARRYPLYLLLHGGPHNGMPDGWHFRWNAQVFAGWGYVTAWHNFHGSSGFGQAFTDSINPHQSELPYQDTIQAARWFAAQPWIDSDRMAAGGGSYGGYLASILLGREHPFKTLVAHAAVFNWFTQYGADYGASKRRFGEFWEEVDHYQKSSPHFGAGNFNTPTLVIHGQLDYRVPLNHGLELFNISAEPRSPQPLRLLPRRKPLDPQTQQLTPLVPHQATVAGRVSPVMGEGVLSLSPEARLFDLDMKHGSFLIFLLTFLFLSLLEVATGAAEWSVPLAGNAFRSAPTPGGDGFRRDGAIAWSDADEVFSIFFHVDRPAALDLALRARVPVGRSSLVVGVGEQTLDASLTGAALALHPLGRAEVPQAGYVRVDLQGTGREGQVYAEIQDLVVASDTDGLVLDYVKSNRGNMFYWGRRGPSVHLRYQVPQDRQLEYAYSEITVPEGQDPDRLVLHGQRLRRRLLRHPGERPRGTAGAVFRVEPVPDG
jgi:8-amino-7-oxononanoate synthase